jgi:uncharacterized cupin superfamily protein
VSENSFNLLSGGLDAEPFAGPGTYGWRGAHVGERLDAKLLGMTVYELERGQKSFPYHYHLLIEEWLLVLSGRPTLRTADGDQTLEPGDVCVFPAGGAGAHQLRNDEDETARFALFSNKPQGDVAVYPNSKKIGIRAAGERYQVRTEPQLDYWDGE